jgi:glycine dehydrogenase subunit 2
VPVIDFDGKKYFKNYNLPDSIGKVKAFYGNFGILVRAYAYILMQGKSLKKVSQDAVMSANYLKECLKNSYSLPYDISCMHEFVLSGEKQSETGVHTINIAKRMMDYGIHPPTVYFPLIVNEAIMIEPTESESKEVLDNFVEIMEKIASEAKENPELVLNAPHSTPVLKIDETLAARNPNLRY